MYLQVSPNYISKYLTNIVNAAINNMAAVFFLIIPIYAMTGMTGNYAHLFCLILHITMITAIEVFKVA